MDSSGSVRRFQESECCQGEARSSACSAPPRRAARRSARPRTQGTPVGLSLNHMIRPLQERRRDRQAEGVGGLEIDHQVKSGGPIDWQINRSCPLEDLIHVVPSFAAHLPYIGARTSKAPPKGESP